MYVLESVCLYEQKLLLGTVYFLKSGVFFLFWRVLEIRKKEDESIFIIHEINKIIYPIGDITLSQTPPLH